MTENTCTIFGINYNLLMSIMSLAVTFCFMFLTVDFFGDGKILFGIFESAFTALFAHMTYDYWKNYRKEKTND